MMLNQSEKQSQDLLLSTSSKKAEISKMLEYRDMGDGFYWITTDEQPFKYFIKAFNHQVKLRGE